MVSRNGASRACRKRVAMVSRWGRQGIAKVSRRYREGIAKVSRRYRDGVAMASRWGRDRVAKGSRWGRDGVAGRKVGRMFQFHTYGKPLPRSRVPKDGRVVPRQGRVCGEAFRGSGRKTTSRPESDAFRSARVSLFQCDFVMGGPLADKVSSCIV